MTDADLLRAAIKASGLSSRGFARLLTRDPRTVFRWLAGKPDPRTGAVPTLPKTVRAKCEQILSEVGTTETGAVTPPPSEDAKPPPLD